MTDTYEYCRNNLLTIVSLMLTEKFELIMKLFVNHFSRVK